MTDNKVSFLPRDAGTFEDEAALFGLLAAFYLRNPDEVLLEAVRKINPQEFDRAPELASCFDRLADYAANPQTDDPVLALKRDWTKLFRGVSPVYGPTPPYALLFLKGNVPEMMADIAALYLDAGYDGYQDIHNRVDYIGTGLQFLQTVALLIVNAVQTQDAATYSRLLKCRQYFLSHYFLPWIGEFCKRAEPFAATDFYKAVLDLTQATLQACAGDIEAAQTGIKTAEESRIEAQREEDEIRRIAEEGVKRFSQGEKMSKAA